jgi:hypothetical protein
MQRLTIFPQRARKVGLTLQAISVDDSTTRVMAAFVSAFWGLVFIGVAFWLFTHTSDGVGAALACLAYSIGYFWFARISHRLRKEGRALQAEIERDW